VAWTRSRPRGRENARPASGGPIAEHATTIYGVAIVSVIGIVAFLALTSTGHVIDAATQHFMLFYAGVFALIALCASVALGLIATDRMILHPGQRIFVQSAHRAASFGALAFLVIHIVTEILAQRVHVLDAFVPFLSPFRTFYIGLGTIASDLVILLVITGIMRKRFSAQGKAWRWRAMHYTSYVAFVFGVWHGLLGGRAAKPYVDWSYGFVVALVALGLAVRILANSLHPKENLSGPPVADSASSGTGPMRAAAMFAQLGAASAATSASASVLETSAPQAVLSASDDGWDEDQAAQGTESVPAYQALPAPVAPAVPPGITDGRQPFYEPGYEGPPRYLGAPRRSGTGPLPRAGTGPMPRAASGPMPRIPSGPMPRATSGPMPRVPSGPMPRATSGPMPRVPSGPMPRATRGQMPQATSGPMPRDPAGPMPRAQSGPMPAAGPMGGAGPAANGGGSGHGMGPVRPAPGNSRARGGARKAPRAASGPVPGADGQQPQPGALMTPGQGSGQARGAHRGGGQPGGGRGGRNRRDNGRPAAPGRAGAPGWGGAPDGGAPGWGEAQNGAPGWGEVQGGAPGWDAGQQQATGWEADQLAWEFVQSAWDVVQPAWQAGQQAWETGAPDPDAGFPYGPQGPGIPGYQAPDQFPGGDELR
jgi:DMSO/TMAO reductase YedYZ heme-binding membrane subunit